MSCKNFRTEIEESDRTAPLGASTAAHVAACGSCRAFSAEREALRSLVGGLGKVDAPADFEFRLRARIARTERARDTGFARRGFVPGAAWLAIAGCAVLALAGFVVFRQAQIRTPLSHLGTATPRDVAIATPSQTPTDAIDPDKTYKPTGASTVKTVNDSRIANRLPKNAMRRDRFVLQPEVVSEMATNQPRDGALETNTRSVQGMKIYVGSPIPLPVTTPDRPLEALFKDAHGASRIVSVDPVTFGARSMPSQRPRMANASYTQGVW